MEIDEPIGVTVGQRSKQHGVHDAEDGRVGADPHGQHRYGHERKQTLADEHAGGEVEVAEQRLHF